MGDVDTIGGYVIRQLNRWPRVGDTIQMGNYQVKVTATQSKRVLQVYFTPMKEEPAAEDAASEI